MNLTKMMLSIVTLCCAAMASAGAEPQADTRAAPPAAKAGSQNAQAEAGEPRADTSSAPAEPPAPAAAAPGPAASGPAASGPASATGPAAASGRVAPAARAAADVKAGPKTASKVDRLDLGTATVTGEREQPKVMYIVPWKRSDIGDLAGKPMNSLVDEVLAPVDRDVFKREVVYYRAVQADASQNGASPKPAPQGEK